VPHQLGVQLSASSDSVLSVGLLARRHQLASGSAAASPRMAAARSVRVPPGAVQDAAAAAELSAQLQQVHTWDRFDVFRVAELTQGRPLYTVTLAIMDALGLLSGWKLDRRKVEAFLTAAEQAYGRANPYHNSRHAADVVHAAFLLLRSVRHPQFTKLEVLALLLAAVVHDVDHPGLTNDFLGKTDHPIAKAYGKGGCNEQHHLATAFSVLEQPGMDMLSGMSPAEADQVRHFVRTAVLCTDMAQHGKLANQLEEAKGIFAAASSKVPRAAASRVPLAPEQAGSSVTDNTSSRPASAPCTEAAAPQGASQAEAEGHARRVVLRAILHTADLSNPARPLPLGADWGHLVAREFFAQGDLERSMGVAVTPFCDRGTVVVATSQLKFISMFLRPQLSSMQGIVGDALMHDLLRHLALTEAYWKSQEAKAASGEKLDC